MHLFVGHQKCAPRLESLATDSHFICDLANTNGAVDKMVNFPAFDPSVILQDSLIHNTQDLLVK